jgi:hypothetical protein
LAKEKANRKGIPSSRFCPADRDAQTRAPSCGALEKAADEELPAEPSRRALAFRARVLRRSRFLLVAGRASARRRRRSRRSIGAQPAAEAPAADAALPRRVGRAAVPKPPWPKPAVAGAQAARAAVPTPAGQRPKQQYRSRQPMQRCRSRRQSGGAEATGGALPKPPAETRCRSRRPSSSTEAASRRGGAGAGSGSSGAEAASRSSSTEAGSGSGGAEAAGGSSNAAAAR